MDPKSELGGHEQPNADTSTELPHTEGADVSENNGVVNELQAQSEAPVAENETNTIDPAAAEATEVAEAAVVETSVEAPVEAVAAAADAAPAAETSTEQASEVAEAESAQAEVPTESVPDTAETKPAEAESVQAEAAAEAPKPFKRGDVLEGVITSTSPTSVTVDLDGKAEGLIPGRELERMSRQMLESLKVGETIPVFVVNPNDHQGNTILSVNRALEELDWKEAETYRKSQEVYEGQVAGYNKGGLIVRFGRLRGFVPQSQVSDDRRFQMEGETPEERYSAMVNTPISVKVMEVDRSRNRLILSERVAFREIREKRKETLIDELEVGEVRTGRVVSMEDFGAFVDVGGAEGLVHLTELSWRHVTHPQDLLKIGQEVRVEVISIDRERKRIGLSIKRQEADPWDEVATNYNVGQLVQATVTKLTKFGAFAKLVDSPDIEGLIHISELSEQRVNHPREVVNENDKLTLRVVKIDVRNRRLGLSLKRVNSAEYLDIDWSLAEDTDSESEADSE